MAKRALKRRHDDEECVNILDDFVILDIIDIIGILDILITSQLGLWGGAPQGCEKYSHQRRMFSHAPIIEKSAHSSPGQVAPVVCRQIPKVLKGTPSLHIYSWRTEHLLAMFRSACSVRIFIPLATGR
jgi:hypothetical protein